MKSIRHFFELIKFEHTIFALPFAYLGMLLAAQGWPTWRQFLWISVAMAAARTLAMAVNRLADRRLDSLNPRTLERPLVTGAISLKTAWTGTVISAAVYVLAAWQLGRLPLLLSPIALVFLIGYSYTKRFTVFSHFILGFTDGLAPVGGWIAVRGSLFTLADLPAWILLGVVTLWIGGFDLIYACQDVEFDRINHLHAIPARHGIAFALRLSAVCHAFTLALLVLLGALEGFAWPYWSGMLIVAGLLGWEHALVRPDDLSKMNLAFFNINSYISLTLLAAVMLGLWVA